MLLRKIFLGALIIFTGAAGLLTAQDKLRLTADEAVRIGLKNSNRLHAARMNVVRSEARVSELSTAMLPSLKFLGAYRRLSPVDAFVISTPFGEFPISPSILDNYTFQISLQQPVFTGFRILSSIEMAEYNAKAESQVYTQEEADYVINVKNGYWQLFKARQLKKVVDENAEQIRTHLKDAKNMLSQGMLTNNDVLKLEVQLSDAMYRQVDVNNSVRLAEIALANTMNIPLDTEIEIVAAVDYNGISYPELDEMIRKALSQRPEIMAAEYRVKATEQSVTFAQSGWYPQLSVSGNYNYNNPNQRIVPAVNEFRGTWDVGVTLSFDIWNWMNTKYQTEQAEASLAQSIDAKEITADAVVLEVTQSYLNTKQADEKIRISEQAVKQSEENMRITSDMFREGLQLSSDVIDAEVALLQAKTNYTNALVDFELAKARLERSIGEIGK